MMDLEKLKNEVEVLKDEYRAVRKARQLLYKDKNTSPFAMEALEKERDRIAESVDALNELIDFFED